MQTTSTSVPARSARRFWHELLRWGLGVVLLLLLFLLFEVGIRHVPPDGMTVTYAYKYSASAVIGTRPYTAPKDQQTIRDAFAAFNAARVVRVPLGQYAGCALTPYPSLVVFTWHGVPVEAWTLEGCWYAESAGGISDERVVEHPLPNITMPLPTPHVG